MRFGVIAEAGLRFWAVDIAVRPVVVSPFHHVRNVW